MTSDIETAAALTEQPRISKRGRVNEGRPPTWTEEASIQLANDLLDWMKQDGNVYWERFFVIERGLRPQLVSELTSKWPEFAEIVKTAKKIQEIKLLEKEGKGEIKSMFVLKNHHNYADRQEIKTENVNYNYDPGELRAKTTDELLELLNAETNTSH